MPNFYAHYLHGQKVFNGLPEKIKQLITHKNAYNIGLQGPDIFYPYKAGKVMNLYKINKLAHQIHYEPGIVFFNKLLKSTHITLPSVLFSYIAGFICHFSVDSICHPYINKRATMGSFSHGEIEIEFDRLLLAMNGFNPTYVKLSEMIKISKEEINSIAAAYTEYKTITPKVIARSIKDYKYFKDFFFSPSETKQEILKFICGTLQLKKVYNSCIMKTKINPESSITNTGLIWLLNYCVSHSQNLIINIYEHITNNEPLSSEFNKPFA